MTVRNLLDTPSYVNWRMAGQIYGVFLLVLQANWTSVQLSNPR